MKSYFAIQQKQTFAGGWMQCLRWARTCLEDNTAPVQILMARGGEKQARVIAEITPEGMRMIRRGRAMTIKGLR